MSEAHEKTRIRQLEDAAAHWEHKYANARQYNRNLEARIAQIEAENESLRHSLYDCTEHGANIAVIVARALGTSKETPEVCACGHHNRYHFADGLGYIRCRATADCNCGRRVHKDASTSETDTCVKCGTEQAETPVSTLCAVCDQIKELHSHPWTPKPSAPETVSKQPDQTAAHSPECWKRVYNPNGKCDCGLETPEKPTFCPVCQSHHRMDQPHDASQAI